MFTQISWGNYTTITIVLLLFYYLFIGFRYYRNDLIQLFTGRKISRDNRLGFTATESLSMDFPELDVKNTDPESSFEKPNIIRSTQLLADEINAFTVEAGRNTLQKDDIIQSVKLLVAKYPAIKNYSILRIVIDEVVIKACKDNCSIHLSEEELSGLW